VALLALLLSAAGCNSVADPRTATLRTGFDTLDGSLTVWPARGELAGDAATTNAVTAAVRDWRSPIDDRVYLPSSGILWSGRVEGTPLALVAAEVPGESASWLLQLSWEPGSSGYAVGRAVEYTDPGYLVYADLLPVQLGDARHYLTSARVQRLTGPDGADVPLRDGLSDAVPVESCRAATLTVTLRETESLPQGRKADRLLDFGTGISDPAYPLVGDASGAGAKALSGLDTCALAAGDGAFGAIARRVGGRSAPQAVAASWPMEEIRHLPLGTVTLDGVAAGRFEQLYWETATGTVTALVYRPADDTAAVVSTPDRAAPLQLYEITLGGRKLVALAWQPEEEKQASVSTPTETERLLERDGLLVVPAPTGKDKTYGLATEDTTHYRSVGDNKN